LGIGDGCMVEVWGQTFGRCLGWTMERERCLTELSMQLCRYNSTPFCYKLSPVFFPLKFYSGHLSSTPSLLLSAKSPIEATQINEYLFRPSVIRSKIHEHPTPNLITPQFLIFFLSNAKFRLTEAMSNGLREQPSIPWQRQ
jgi:hypothetical protein